MHIVSRSVQRPRTMIAPLPIDARGSQAESLTSWFEALCEANHLPTSNVLTYVLRPLIRRTVSESKVGDSRWLHDSVPFLHGTPATNDICRALEAASGASDLIDKTFLPWNAQCPTYPLFAHAKTKRWCAHCYSTDLEQYGRTYDRLLWSVAGATICPTHQRALTQKCSACGRDGHRHLHKRNVAGFCQFCATWLGEVAEEPGRMNDLHQVYQLETTRGIALVLERPNEAWADASTQIARVLKALCHVHHAGNLTAMSKHLGRGKGTVWSWLQGEARPRHDALQTIAFAYSIPLPQLLLGSVDIRSTTLNELPHQRLTRGRYVRTLIQRTDDEILTFLERLIAHPQETEIRSLVAVGRQVGRTPRDLSHRFPVEMAALKVAIAAMKSIRLERARVDRRRIIEEAVQSVLERLPRSVYPSRRKIMKILAADGLTLTYWEEKELVGIVREIAAREGRSLRSRATQR